MQSRVEVINRYGPLKLFESNIVINSLQSPWYNWKIFHALGDAGAPRTAEEHSTWRLRWRTVDRMAFGGERHKIRNIRNKKWQLDFVSSLHFGFKCSANSDVHRHAWQGKHAKYSTKRHVKRTMHRNQLSFSNKRLKPKSASNPQSSWCQTSRLIVSKHQDAMTV